MKAFRKDPARVTRLRTRKSEDQGVISFPPAPFRTDDTDEALQWIIDRTEEAKVRDEYGIRAWLTPAMARVLLTLNPENRYIRQRRVEEIAEDIEAGRWKSNGETIILSKEPLLNNGQHRCLAVLRTNTPILLAFWFGAERDTRDTLDQGSPRTSADIIVMLDGNRGDAAACAATAGLLVLWHNHETVNRGGGTQASKVRVVAAFYEHEQEILNALNVVPRKVPKVLGTRSFLMFVYLTFAAKNERAAQEFMQLYLEGNIQVKDHPILVARNRMIEDPHGMRHPMRKLECLVRAWNFWRKGLHMKRVMIMDNIPAIES
jgi:hypothetical protein